MQIQLGPRGRLIFSRMHQILFELFERSFQVINAAGFISSLGS